MSEREELAKKLEALLKGNDTIDSPEAHVEWLVAGIKSILRQPPAPVQVTPMMVGNAIATYHATDGDWWKVCAEILSAAAPAPGEGR